MDQKIATSAKSTVIVVRNKFHVIITLAADLNRRLTGAEKCEFIRSGRATAWENVVAQSFEATTDNQLLVALVSRSQQTTQVLLSNEVDAHFLL